MIASLIGSDGIFIGIDDFGTCGKATDLFGHFGVTANKIWEKIIAQRLN